MSIQIFLKIVKKRLSFNCFQVSENPKRVKDDNTYLPITGNLENSVFLQESSPMADLSNLQIDATSIFKTWLSQNSSNPFPSEDQKREWAKQTGRSGDSF